jgi:ABC-type nitrate/sulfonate/bicarbonate transport system permease component
MPTEDDDVRSRFSKAREAEATSQRFSPEPRLILPVTYPEFATTQPSGNFRLPSLYRLVTALYLSCGAAGILGFLIKVFANLAEFISSSCNQCYSD